MKSSHVVLGAAVAALLGAAGSADAQERDRWMLPYPTGVDVPTFTIESEAARGAPGSSAGSQVAFGANWGTAYVGVGFQGRTRYAEYNRDGVDGGVSAGFGLGNSAELVGLDVSIAMLGTVDNPGKFSFGFKAHRMLPGNAAIAVGVENAYVTSEVDTNRSFFGVISKQLTFAEPTEMFSSMTISAGLGNGRYLLEEDFQADANKVNFFGSVGVRISEPVGFVADWTGQDLALALSLVPFKSLPITITPGFADVTGNAGDGPRFTVGAGMGFYLSNLLPGN